MQNSVKHAARAAITCAAIALSSIAHAHGDAPRNVDADNAAMSAACKAAKLSAWFEQQRRLDTEPNAPLRLPAECVGTPEGNARAAKDASAMESMKTAETATPRSRD